ncbi:hypothetical protein GCM10018952_40000 [Streptosporangium vulgare]
MVSAIRDQRADLGLTDLPVPTDLISHPLERQEIVLISPPGVDLPDPVPMRRLNGMRLVLPVPGSSRRREFDALFAKHGVAPVVATQLDERGNWLSTVRSGTASMLWYRGMAEQAARAGLVVRTLDPSVRRVIAIVHARRRLPAIAQEFPVRGRKWVGRVGAPRLIGFPRFPQRRRRWERRPLRHRAIGSVSMTILRLRGREFRPGEFAIMAVVNRTPDSFFDRGRTYGFAAALEAVDGAVAGGADIVDIGGVKAGPGDEVDPAEEIRRVADLVAEVRRRHPRLVVSVDTWRAEVAEVVAEAGADLLNDTWGGGRPRAGRGRRQARHRPGLRARRPRDPAHPPAPHRLRRRGRRRHRLHRRPRRARRRRGGAQGVDPHRPGARLRQEHLALPGGQPPPGRDGRHRLAGARRGLQQGLRRRGTLGGLPVDERHAGTMATLAVSAWQGARVFRVHDAASARAALATVGRLRR